MLFNTERMWQKSIKKKKQDGRDKLMLGVEMVILEPRLVLILRVTQSFSPNPSSCMTLTIVVEEIAKATMLPTEQELGPSSFPNFILLQQEWSFLRLKKELKQSA